MALRPGAAVRAAPLLIASALLGQGNRQEAVQAAMNKHAIIAAERQGALILRDLGVHCGVAEAELKQLGTALNKAIAEWVLAHPPQMYGATYDADFRAIVQLETWTKALQEIASAEARAAWQAIESGRERRLVSAIAGFVHTMAACKLRLTPAQVTALAPLCQRIGEQSLEMPVRARPEQLVREVDRSGARVLSPLQSEYPELLAARRGSRRDAVLEFELECERIRLLCQLDEQRAHLLRACGRSQGRNLVAEQVEKDKARAKEAAAAKAAGTPATTPVPRPVNVDLPNEECLADPFWVKVRDSVLTAEEKALLAQSAPVGKPAVAAARLELVLASMDSLFHLDPEQVKALTPLAQKVVEQDLESSRASTFDVTRAFGIQTGRGETTPEERAAKKALEDLLDRPQFEVLRDKVGM